MKKGNISGKSHILWHDNLKKKGTLQTIISEEYRVVFNNNSKKKKKWIKQEEYYLTWNSYSQILRKSYLHSTFMLDWSRKWQEFFIFRP